MVQSQPGQIVHKTLSQKKKKTHHKKRVGGVAQGVNPELKSQYHKTNKKKEEWPSGRDNGNPVPPLEASHESLSLFTL
jgi:hypothetical protein